MSFHFRATAPEETDSVLEFLAEVFGTKLDAAAARWRFHDPRPDWPGSRSYVLERNGEIAAHGCVWPMPFSTPEGTVTACQIVDWAGARRFPGAGLLLRRKIEELVNVSVGIGGSEDSRRIMPRSGYSTVAQFRRYVRVVRPIRQLFERRDGPAWKRAAKAARNLAWAATPNTKQPAAAGASDFIATQRSPELIAHLLRCPAARMSAGNLKHGSFLLSEVHGQTRIADLQVTNSDWRTAVVAATKTAAALPDTSEIVADTTLDAFADALIEAGYRPAGEQPVFIRDPENHLQNRPLHITSADYDACFAFFPKGHFAG